MREVTEWSIFYAAGQTVKLVLASKGQVFLPCAKTDPDARCRYRYCKPGETLARCKAAFQPITDDHVDLVLAILARGGALDKQSWYEAWVEFDEGALRDECITSSCSRNNFASLWSVMAFVNYATLTYNEQGYVVSSDPIFRVRTFIQEAERNWDLNWTFGQFLCLDEYGSPGAQSRY